MPLEPAWLLPFVAAGSRPSWPSRLSGGLGVAGSNPARPIRSKRRARAKNGEPGTGCYEFSDLAPDVKRFGNVDIRLPVKPRGSD